MIRKRLLSACLALALCLGLLPVTAEAAAEGAPSQLYVGNYLITNSGTTTYLKAGSTQGSLEEGSETDWTVKYDPSTATLTLSGATIKGGSDVVSIPYGSGIYAQGSSNQPVTLTIELIGENTITGTFGIYVNAEINASSYGTNATLTIMGDNNGSLEVSGSNNGIYVKSGTGNASLNIKNVAVTSSTNDKYDAGVYVMSSNYATNSPNISLSVDGGSLTASGTGSSDGILFYVGSSQATGATTSLTITDHAIVDARNGGISALKISETLPTPTPTGDNRSGIVFDGNTGTVYGKVELQEDLEIGEGESLTIPDGASLTIGNDATLTNEGTVTTTDGGTLTNEGTINNSGTLTGTISGNAPPSITKLSLDGGTVGTAYTTTLAADGEPTSWTWSAAAGSNTPPGLTLNNDGTITGTPTAAGTYSFTVTATNDYGSDSKEFTLTIDQQGTIHVTSVSLDKASLELTEGETAQLTATVTPEGATNKNVTWSTSDASIATVTDGVVTAVSAGTATITVTTVDGGKTDTCTVTVREEAPDRPVNIPDTYDIDLIVGEGGKAKLSLTNASAGSTITVTATPDDGYELDYITVDGERIDGTTFTMPNHDVTVRVYFTDGAALPFTDVSAGAWYFDAVGYVYVGGLMDGVSDTLFDPDGTMTRAMVWAILARVDGETVTGANWADTAREWAVAEGVSDGENATDYVTREQFATMLWRYASGKGYDVSIGEDTNILSYADFADLSEYAIPAMQWACGAGVITGVTDATLVPQGEATRAQCAAMLMRFVEAIG